MLLGDERTITFFHTGTIWGIVGEEEETKILGKWRIKNQRLEVLYGARAKLRQRKGWQPLKILIDEAPSRLMIANGKLAGEYEVGKFKKLPPHNPNEREIPPVFELD